MCTGTGCGVADLYYYVFFFIYLFASNFTLYRRGTPKKYQRVQYTANFGHAPPPLPLREECHRARLAKFRFVIYRASISAQKTAPCEIKFAQIKSSSGYPLRAGGKIKVARRLRYHRW